MSVPKLAYCAQKGRIDDGLNRHGGGDVLLNPKTLEHYLRLGRRLRSEALVAVVATLGRGLTKPFEGIRQYRSKRRAIGQLRELPDRMLKDIGIGRSDIIAVVEGLCGRTQYANEYRVIDNSEPARAALEQSLDRAA